MLFVMLMYYYITITIHHFPILIHGQWPVALELKSVKRSLCNEAGWGQKSKVRSTCWSTNNLITMVNLFLSTLLISVWNNIYFYCVYWKCWLLCFYCLDRTQWFIRIAYTTMEVCAYLKSSQAHAVNTCCYKVPESNETVWLNHFLLFVQSVCRTASFIKKPLIRTINWLLLGW